MSAPARKLALSEVQCLIVDGYRHHRCRYFLLKVRDPAEARRFLSALVAEGWVESADKPLDMRTGISAHESPATPVSVGISYPGLRALGLKRRFIDPLQARAPAFQQGAHCRSASRLADTGASAARYWDPRFDRDRVHVLVVVHGDESEALSEACAALGKLAGEAFEPDGWRDSLDACHLNPVQTACAANTANTAQPTGPTDRLAMPDPAHPASARRRVHFGFVDGISKVLIKGVPRHDRSSRDQALAHEPGEFLLGYQNDKGYNPWLLACQPPDAELPPRRLGDASMPSPLQPGEFFVNGSFAAFRDMAQHEKAFRGYTDACAAPMGVSGDFVRAKMLGRWPEGQVVEPGHMTVPTSTAQGAAALDDFDFSTDADGHGCPFGSHVRRMNPRADGVVPFRRRPLIRRGMPYGQAYAEDEEDGLRRGLLGLFFCASLEDQFEHLVSEWGDGTPLGTPNRGSSKDPLIGNHTQGHAPFDIPVAEGPLRQLNGMAPFITTRGTAYLFFPGLNALRAMGDERLFEA